MKLKELNNVFDIDWYLPENLPTPLLNEAKRQNVDLDSGGLIFVRSYLDPAPEVDIVRISAKPPSIKELMHELARQDGIDLNTAFAPREGDEPP